MPLDPQVKALIDMMAAAGQPPIATLTPVQAREAYRAMTAATDVKDIPVETVENLSIPGPGGPLPLRIYTPAGRPKGTLVWFHGGGFVIGDLETHDGLCRRLCRDSGARVVAVDYRLSPEHRHGAAIADCLAATDWAVQRFSNAKIAVGGDSAGGNLAAIVAQRSCADTRSNLALQILLCPWLDLFADPNAGSRKAYGVDHVLDVPTLDWFRRLYLGDFADPRDVSISPGRTRSLDDNPPAYVLTAECDPLRDDGRAYADRLGAANVPVIYVNAPGMIHNFFCMAQVIPAAGPAVADVARVLSEALA